MEMILWPNGPTVPCPIFGPIEAEGDFYNHIFSCTSHRSLFFSSSCFCASSYVSSFYSSSFRLHLLPLLISLPLPSSIVSLLLLFVSFFLHSSPNIPPPLLSFSYVSCTRFIATIFCIIFSSYSCPCTSSSPSLPPLLHLLVFLLIFLLHSSSCFLVDEHAMSSNWFPCPTMQVILSLVSSSVERHRRR